MTKIIKELVPQKMKLAQYEKERISYQAYCETVHRGRWRAAKVHSFICKKLEAVARGEITRLMLFMPPQHGKSQAVTETFPSWFLGHHPDARVIEVSYGINFAEKFGLLNRRKVEEYGNKIFGIQISQDKSSKTNWSLARYTGGMLSVGIGGGITGEGAELMIIDDPIKNRQEAESVASRQRLWNEWQDTLVTRIRPGGAIIFIMTRWREDDLAGMILEDAKKHGEYWDVIRFPCLAEENDVLGRIIGEALWTEGGRNKQWAQKQKSVVGSRTWNALYQQNPLPAEGNIIKQAWWKYYNVIPQNFDMIFQSWDMSFKGGEKNDYVVGQVWGKIGINYYLIDQERRKMGLPDTIKALRALKSKWPKTSTILIEDKANGSGIIDALKNEISGIVPITPDSSKEARCWAASAEIEAGNVYIPSPKTNPWIEEFITEFTRFPNSKNDDQVDCATQAINWGRSKKMRVWEAVRMPWQ